MTGRTGGEDASAALEITGGRPETTLSDRTAAGVGERGCLSEKVNIKRIQRGRGRLHRNIKSF